jgi:predicted XRE-type DNA-binding protein
MSAPTTSKRMSRPRREPNHNARPLARPGSGNVFADLGLADAGGRLAKAELARQLCSMIAAAGLTQRQAAARLGVDQPKVSSLMRGVLKDFSTERLMRFVTAMNHDVVISIRPAKDRHRPTLRVSAEA